MARGRKAAQGRGRSLVPGEPLPAGPAPGATPTASRPPTLPSPVQSHQTKPSVSASTSSHCTLSPAASTLPARRTAGRGTPVRATSSTPSRAGEPMTTGSSLGCACRAPSRVRDRALTTGHAEHRLATGPPEAQSLQARAWSRGPGGWPESSASDARASVGHSPRGVAPQCVSTGREHLKSKRLTTPNRTEPPSLQGAHGI